MEELNFVIQVTKCKINSFNQISKKQVIEISLKNHSHEIHLNLSSILGTSTRQLGNLKSLHLQMI